MLTLVEEAEFPASPGVYLVYQGRRDDRPLYVGMASDLHERWQGCHLEPRAARSHLRLSVGVHLGLMPEEVMETGPEDDDSVEQRITEFLARCWIELLPADTAAAAEDLAARAASALDPLLRPSPPRSGGGEALDGTLESIARDYRRRYREHRLGELRYYAAQSNLEEAIRAAATARTSDGRRHPHQRGISAVVLNAAAERLLGADIESCDDFPALIAEVEEAIGCVKGIGGLTVYDTALRLGAFLRMAPDRVYLHASVREGARALGLVDTGAVDVTTMPDELQALQPWEIEDVLRLYKKQLKEMANA